MSKFRRQLMMASISEPIPPLPYDAEVEYLESTGTQYIDTGIKGNFTSKYLYHIEVKWKSASHRQLMGAQNLNFFGIDGSGKYESYYAMTQSGSTSSFDVVEFGMAYLSAYAKTYRRFTYINGALSTTSWESRNLFSKNDICIFGMLNTGGNSLDSAFACECYIRHFKIYNDQTGDVYFDGIPVRVGQVGYMYDKVSKQLFGNQGTGNFILGNDVS